MLVLTNVKLDINYCEFETDKDGKYYLSLRGFFYNDVVSHREPSVPRWVVNKNRFAKCLVYGEYDELDKLRNIFKAYWELRNPLFMKVLLPQNKRVYLRNFYFSGKYVPFLYIFDFVFKVNMVESWLKIKAISLLPMLEPYRNKNDEPLSDDEVLENIEDILDGFEDDIEINETKIKDNQIKDNILKNALK